MNMIHTQVQPPGHDVAHLEQQPVDIFVNMEKLMTYLIFLMERHGTIGQMVTSARFSHLKTTRHLTT
jgi:hypothetical protein